MHCMNNYHFCVIKNREVKERSVPYLHACKQKLPSSVVSDGVLAIIVATNWYVRSYYHPMAYIHIHYSLAF